MITAEHDIFDTTDNENVHTVEKMTLHPKWDANTLIYDYAILEVKPEIDLTDRARPVCLPENDVEDNFVNQETMFTVSGWGLRKGQHGE